MDMICGRYYSVKHESGINNSTVAKLRYIGRTTSGRKYYTFTNMMTGRDITLKSTAKVQNIVPVEKETAIPEMMEACKIAKKRYAIALEQWLASSDTTLASPDILSVLKEVKKERKNSLTK